MSIAPGCHLEPDGSVAFAIRAPGAARVELVGDFTGWLDAPVPMQASDGLWSTRLSSLPPAAYAYKYLIDGTFAPDPANPLGRADGFGGRNAAFVVGGRPIGAPAAVRIASLNLHTWQEGEPHAKLEQIGFGLAASGADIVLLQEVGEHIHDPRRGNAGEILRGHLMCCTGRPWHHTWRMAHIGFDVYREGLSVLSSAPLEAVAAYQLSEGFFARIALFATTSVRGLTVRVGTTHVSWGATGGEEIAAMLDHLERDAATGHAAVVVAGDFNAEATQPAVRHCIDAGFVDAAGAGAAPTYGPTDLHDRIDYMLVRPAAGEAPLAIEGFERVFDGGPAASGFRPRVSDHAGLLAAFRRR